MQSAIYEGRVRHRRTAPVDHEFSYSLCMLYLDLAELDDVFRGRWLWSTRRAAPFRFRRDDHFGDPSKSLDEVVRDTVEASTGSRPSGPIRLLTQLRSFGYCFNPASFYYCFDANGQDVEAIVTEVNNTPWGERHIYVLDRQRCDARGNVRRFSLRKDFHVSPFLPMDLDYDWRFSVPGDNLSVHMNCATRAGKTFEAMLALDRKPLSGRALAETALRHPLMSFKIITGIYWQALRLWIKGTPVYDHPSNSSNTGYHRT